MYRLGDVVGLEGEKGQIRQVYHSQYKSIRIQCDKTVPMEGSLLVEQAQQEGRCGLPVDLRWSWSCHDGHR
jgi:hypothetical protein